MSGGRFQVAQFRFSGAPKQCSNRLEQLRNFVLSAADGHEGLELSRKYPGTIDLVITDVNMPRMNGTDLCGHLMEERPRIKMLMMTGADLSEIVSQNANLPFLPKPFDGQTLISRRKPRGS